ncbi:serine hydrolase domain-containing protein [Microbacterium oleivorans]|uniref:Class A beta-lactamase-related serine hydrolase n=1 Tax=Microbacterium oleivorans TaxID=273677 RepID=A0A4R5YG99_9MICO|nr:serine hydrolase domain-containing protein [Microbacterium oleivorans]TDL44222.1 class A beta-lactamase-related serine hydrolase [Microbacterium oleivorans]
MTALDDAVAVSRGWDVPHASVAVVAADGRTAASAGDQDRVYRLASVTKLLSAYAALVAVEEGALSLDQPAGPPGATVEHLLAHTAGYDFSSTTLRAAPGERRLYSNTGFEVLADLLESETGIAFDAYAQEAVFAPLGMAHTSIGDSAAAGGSSTTADLARFAAELQQPRLLDPATLERATGVSFPGRRGVLPGFGQQPENDWGLGLEIRGTKSPHWTGAHNSPETFGHFGQSGTFLWVDPRAGAALVALTDRPFGPWAAEVWPPFSDGVLEALRTG